MLVLGLAVTAAVIALARRHAARADARDVRNRRRRDRRVVLESDLRALRGDADATEDQPPVEPS